MGKDHVHLLPTWRDPLSKQSSSSESRAHWPWCQQRVLQGHLTRLCHHPLLLHHRRLLPLSPWSRRLHLHHLRHPPQHLQLQCCRHLHPCMCRQLRAPTTMGPREQQLAFRSLLQSPLCLQSLCPSKARKAPQMATASKKFKTIRYSPMEVAMAAPAQDLETDLDHNLATEAPDRCLVEIVLDLMVEAELCLEVLCLYQSAQHRLEPQFQHRLPRHRQQRDAGRRSSFAHLRSSLPSC